MVEYEELIGHYKKWLSLGAEKGTNEIGRAHV